MYVFAFPVHRNKIITILLGKDIFIGAHIEGEHFDKVGGI